ncbi:MAG: glutamate racemase, partial [Thermomicrobiales bacterium]
DLSGAAVEATVETALAPLLMVGHDRAGQAEQIDTLLLGCTHYPLLRPLIAALVGEQVAIVDSATATASAVAEILAVNGLGSPGDVEPTHRQLTTGDADAFHTLAARLFGSAFPEVEQIELAVAAR